MNIKRFFPAFILIATSALLLGYTGTATCKKLNLESDCSAKLRSFNYSRGFDIAPSMFHYGGEKIKFNHFLTKGNTYVFTLCDASTQGDQLILELANKNGQMAATNYNKVTKVRYSKVFYPCKATGVYTLNYSFLNMNPVCAASVLGFQVGITSKQKPTSPTQ